MKNIRTTDTGQNGIAAFAVLLTLPEPNQRIDERRWSLASLTRMRHSHWNTIVVAKEVMTVSPVDVGPGVEHGEHQYRCNIVQKKKEMPHLKIRTGN